MTVDLLPGERVDDLLVNGLGIIQRPTEFRFGCDAVELANFVTGGARDRAVDLGSGSGIITILLGGKKGIRCTGVEILPSVAEMSRRSILLNDLGEKCDVVTAPMQRVKEFFAAGEASIVVTNPPYRPLGSGKTQEKSAVAVARHEIAVTLAEVLDSAEYLLKNGGAFYMIHRADRLAEAMSGLTARGLEPKVLQLLTPAEGKGAHLFMVKCVKRARPGLKILPVRVVDTAV